MARSRIIRQIRHGQITIPKEIREEVDLDPADLLRITADADGIRIVPVKTTERQTGSAWARELYDLFEPVRVSLDLYSEDEINDAIDEAIRKTRAEAKRRQH